MDRSTMLLKSICEDYTFAEWMRFSARIRDGVVNCIGPFVTADGRMVGPVSAPPGDPGPESFPSSSVDRGGASPGGVESTGKDRK